jgi:hypothetical protein
MQARAAATVAVSTDYIFCTSSCKVMKSCGQQTAESTSPYRVFHEYMASRQERVPHMHIIKQFIST